MGAPSPPGVGRFISGKAGYPGVASGCTWLMGRGAGLPSGSSKSLGHKEVGSPSPKAAFPLCNSLEPSSSRKPSRSGCKGRAWRPAPCPAPPSVAPGCPHLSVPLIGDSLDLNLFPPHLLWGSSVLERGGDRWAVVLARLTLCS